MVGCPDFWFGRGENVREAAAALDAFWRRLRNLFLRGELVTVLYQQPLPAVRLAAAARSHEDPRAPEFLAGDRKFQLALLDRLVYVLILGRLPGASVPEQDDSCSVAFGNHAFELAVFDWVVFDLHRKPLVSGIERGPFGHGPRHQHARVLQPQVVVQVTGKVLLNAELQPPAFGLPPYRRLWLRRCAEVPFTPILPE